MGVLVLSPGAPVIQESLKRNLRRNHNQQRRASQLTASRNSTVPARAVNSDRAMDSLKVDLKMPRDGRESLDPQRNFRNRTASRASSVPELFPAGFLVHAWPPPLNSSRRMCRFVITDRKSHTSELQSLRHL